MDFINKFANQASGNQGDKPQGEQQQQSSSGGGLLDKLHGMAGGGPESEKKEDALDKGIDMVQEKLFKAGDQSNESAAEQAKDRFIADQIRDQYKKATGKDFPVGGKPKEAEKKSDGPDFGNILK
ncbi:hypothetical protein B0I37DRAFT_73806 [Chaetomium sp. MPI-CAGE-AT-0009]|nr:hypothetical protein B0I37DRAFT_73806 [Chaetomium sp. MPI-CAGE-AT-0009]